MRKTKIRLILIAGIVMAAIVVILAINKRSLNEKINKTVMLKSTPVSVAEVKTETIAGEIVLVGTVYANNDVMVASEASGKIVQIYAQPGDYVKAGNPIVKVDDELKQAAFNTAEMNYEKAKKDYDRNEDLYKSKSVSDAQYEAVKLAYKSAEAQFITAKRQLKDTKISAPFSGILTSRNVDLGAMVNNGTIIGNLVDISTLKVKVNLSEKDAFAVKQGNKVTITTDVYENAEFSAAIKSISSKADESHTFPVEIWMSNNSATPLRAGMFVKIHFNYIDRQNALVIPREAVVGSIKAPKVFVVEGNKAVLKPIVARAEVAKKVAVTSGLNAGDKVIINGQINIKDGSEVTIIK